MRITLINDLISPFIHITFLKRNKYIEESIDRKNDLYKYEKKKIVCILLFSTVKTRF